MKAARGKGQWGRRGGVGEGERLHGRYGRSKLLYFLGQVVQFGFSPTFVFLFTLFFVGGLLIDGFFFVQGGFGLTLCLPPWLSKEKTHHDDAQPT